MNRYIKEGDAGTLVPELIYGCLWKQKYDVIVEKLMVELKFNNLIQYLIYLITILWI